jgi:hypothetical protein
VKFAKDAENLSDITEAEDEKPAAPGRPSSSENRKGIKVQGKTHRLVPKGARGAATRTCSRGLIAGDPSEMRA